MGKFISCDWGTSTFRIKVVDTARLEIIAGENTKQGIAKTFALWKQSDLEEQFRVPFYLEIIKQQITHLENKLRFSLAGCPVIISGMASSSIGIMNLPYKEMPFFTNGTDLARTIVDADDNFMHETTIVSGVKTIDDAMRGEETQLVGCVQDHSGEERLFIFPGTHSKHVTVEKGMAIRIKTFMTGEFFELLSKRSILSHSVDDGSGHFSGKNLEAFQWGCSKSIESDLLHSAFLVRTNELFGKISKQENYYFLSGLLIGTELKEIEQKNFQEITLVGNSLLLSYYEAAFKTITKGKGILKIQDAETATIAGHFALLKRFVDEQ